MNWVTEIKMTVPLHNKKWLFLLLNYYLIILEIIREIIREEIWGDRKKWEKIGRYDVLVMVRERGLQEAKETTWKIMELERKVLMKI